MVAPTRVTIIPTDTVCTIDGVVYRGVNMTSISPEVHAVQWYGTYGEIEIKDPVTGKIVANIGIENLDSYQEVLSSYWEIRTADEAAQQAAQQSAIDEQTIVEV
jgi:hypothetical protein